MTLADAKKLIEFCQDRGIKRIRSGAFAVEFFPKMPEPMALDPLTLSKALTDSMPPDSAMMFASRQRTEILSSSVSKIKSASFIKLFFSC